MGVSVIERYLSDIGEIHRTGSHVAETSFYPALERLLSDIGSRLSPKVRCVINLKDSGAGIPDGGLFTADQFRRSADTGDIFKGLLPARGVFEAKGPREELEAIAKSEQVRRYWEHYRVVLVTNFRAFILIGSDADGEPCKLESFSLADSEEEFWHLVARPRKGGAVHGERMLEYLKRVLLCNAPLGKPEDVAAILASYAHDARLRMQGAELPALTSVREALEEALGLRFEGDRGEHFFRSTLIQTLFYGVFSAWVFWARKRSARNLELPGSQHVLRESSLSYGGDRYDWRTAQYLLRVPMLRALFVQVADPGHLGALGLTEVLDWTAAALNRVDCGEFFQSFDEGHAVQYFYEPFLHAFDPALRKQLGVWYTPEEIVRYQVERVDAVLRSELGIADGLADPKVVVLDPCCGTGAYLRAVLRRIATTLRNKGGDALLANDLKRAAMERVFGFEILPAPFVIAHLQLGLELETLGAPLQEHKGQPPERVGVYLTNALTGWEPTSEKPKQIAFPGFADERDAADKVKQEKPILVVIGNPPYNAYAGVSPEEENELVEVYKNGLISEWGIKKFNLDDLYVRFFRLAEKRVAEKGGRGVVSFISNFSYLGDPSFVVARRRFLTEFDEVWLDCMNGDSRETGKLTPEGTPDPSVFSTEWNREGIRVGTAISLLVKRAKEQTADATVRFRHFWGTQKRSELLASLEAADFDAQYEVAEPSKENRWSFRPSKVSSEYLAWPKLTELCAEAPYNGPVERRGLSLISMERNELSVRMQAYFDPSVTDDQVAKLHPSLMMTGNRIVGPEARQKLLKESSFDEGKIVSYPFKTMDNRFCYLDNIRPLFSEPSPRLLAQRFSGNKFFITRDTADKNPEGTPFYFSPLVCDYDCISGHARHFPIWLKSEGTASSSSGSFLPGFALEPAEITANLSSLSRSYLSSLGCADPDADLSVAELIWHHALAIGYSPAYLEENADGVRQDWPRVPLPQTRQLLEASAALGRQVAALLDSEKPVPAVTTGEVPPELQSIAVFSRLDGKPANPAAGDLELRAGWGHAGKNAVTMPGKGKILDNADGSYDIFLNEVACWRNLPKPVWEYCIGGYQVIKKWLSYREKTLLGRGLFPDEARYVSEMARRLAALIALQTELDENYRKIKDNSYS